ncbi:MAG TPA: hypothetical protein G4O00_04025 [Thermoflexia bacterium]|nr:hypothetical protein [Thermoflexia bacterium]
MILSIRNGTLTAWGLERAVEVGLRPGGLPGEQECVPRLDLLAPVTG